MSVSQPEQALPRATVDPVDRLPTGPIDSDPVDYYRGRDLADLPPLIDEALIGIELGSYDRRIVDWLKGWDQPTIVAIASLLHRGRAAGTPGQDQETHA